MMFPLTFRSIIGISILICAAFGYLLWKDTRPKEDYQFASGAITYIGKSYGNLQNSYPEKIRYIEVEDFPYPFAVFVGKDSGDFSPKLEKIDSLKLGDIVTVYFSYQDDMDYRGDCSTVKYIYKGDDLYYKTRLSVGLLLFVVLIVSIVPTIGFILWRKGKIPY